MEVFVFPVLISRFSPSVVVCHIQIKIFRSSFILPLDSFSCHHLFRSSSGSPDGGGIAPEGQFGSELIHPSGSRTQDTLQARDCAVRACMRACTAGELVQVITPVI